MTSVSKYACIDKLQETVKNTATIFMHQSNWNLLMLNLIDLLIFLLNLKKYPKFKVGDHEWISKYKNMFSNYTPNWTKELFVIKHKS